MKFHVSVKYGPTRYNIALKRGAGKVLAMPMVERVSPGEFLIDIKDMGESD